MRKTNRVQYTGRRPVKRGGTANTTAERRDGRYSLAPKTTLRSKDYDFVLATIQDAKPNEHLQQLADRIKRIQKEAGVSHTSA